MYQSTSLSLQTHSRAHTNTHTHTISHTLTFTTTYVYFLCLFGLLSLVYIQFHGQTIYLTEHYVTLITPQTKKHATQHAFEQTSEQKTIDENSCGYQTFAQ
jgi:hypothetical protein